MIEEMRVEGSRVGIVGGSIAGCAAAIALQRLGCEVEIFERSSGALRDRGSGIGIPIALRDELIDHGYLPEGYATVALPGRRWVAADGSPEGRTLWTIDGASVSNNWGVLWKGLRERVDDAVYHDGVAIDRVESLDHCAVVHFDDGSSKPFDLVIGADGYRSRVRAMVSAGEPTYAGYILWRGNFPEAELTDRREWDRIQDEGRWLSVGFEGGHGVIYPIPDFDSDGSPGNRRVNWAIYAPTPDGLTIDSTMSIPPGAVEEPIYAQLQTLLAEHFPEVARPLFASPREEVSIQPIYDTAVDAYVRDRVVLIGDAGTMSRPHTAPGATKAIQDARLLETLGGDFDTWGPLLGAYDDESTRAGKDLVELGRRIGRDQVENTPPWLEMTEDDYESWTAGTLSGDTLYFWGDDTDQDL